jgi:DNA-binding transcriptional LysR family regulator
MSPSELRPKQCLAVIDPQSARPTPWTFERYGTKECVEPDSAIILGDTDAAISAALHHFGYVQAPNLAVQHLLGAGLLKPVLTEWADDAALPLYLVYPGHRQQSVMIKALCGFLKMTLPLQARPRKEQRSRLPLISRDTIRVVDAHV